jgi:sulfate transport system permease protein
MATALSLRDRLRRQLGVLPGFGLSFGITSAWLGLIVLLPISALFIHASGLGWDGLWAKLNTPRVIAAFQLTFGAAFAAALVNLVFGVLTAWVLVRYKFWGRRFFDAMVDLPFALPTAVAGIALTALFAPNGWIGTHLYDPDPSSPANPDGPLGTFGPAQLSAAVHWLNLHLPGWLGFSPDPEQQNAFVAWLGSLAVEGIRINYTPIGIAIALTFIGLPFVVRTVQPVLEELSKETEEAAACLGASRPQIILRIIFPELLPAICTGFALAFARAIGEYGSVVFISGAIPRQTEIVPHLIIIRLEQYDYQGATALGAAMLVASFAMLLIINLLQRWAERRAGSAT